MTTHPRELGKVDRGVVVMLIMVMLLQIQGVEEEQLDRVVQPVEMVAQESS
jgi:hypothetical protein